MVAVTGGAQVKLLVQPLPHGSCRILVQVAVFLAWPPPLDGTAADWFTLLQNRRVVGLIDLDLLLAGDVVLLIPVLLAFYVVLGRTHPSLVAVAVALGFTSVAMYHAPCPVLVYRGEHTGR